MRIRRTPVTLVVPEGMPVLAAGTHLVPEDGVCLMEYVSVLAGERFTDHPRCTEPTLAFLARLVNDTVSDDVRSRLAPLAADLCGLGRADAVGSARLVVAVVHRAGAAAIPSRGLLRAERRAERRLRRVATPGPLGRLACALSPLHMRGAGRHRLTTAVAAVVTASWPDDVDRDEALLELLQVAMAVVRSSALQLVHAIDVDIPPTGPQVGRRDVPGRRPDADCSATASNSASGPTDGAPRDSA
jgi:hypothetical protein